MVVLQVGHKALLLHLVHTLKAAVLLVFMTDLHGEGEVEVVEDQEIMDQKNMKSLRNWLQVFTCTVFILTICDSNKS